MNFKYLLIMLLISSCSVAEADTKNIESTPYHYVETQSVVCIGGFERIILNGCCGKMSSIDNYNKKGNKISCDK